MSQKLKISELIPHDQNSYYFDDMNGDAWTEFVESVRTSGVIEPIVVTQDKTIVSGHQRVRACKALGIDEIEAEVRIIDSEDEVLKQLIETNIRQRGVGNTNPVKFGRCLMELERIYGVKQGKRTDIETFPNNSEKSQEDLASELGISVDTLNNYKKIATAIPEIQSLVESGRVTKTVALGLMKKLSEEEQKQLAEMLPYGADKLSSREIKFYTDRITKLTEENKTLRTQKPEKVIETVEVVPNDYDDLKEQLSAALFMSEKLKDQVQASNPLNEALRELRAIRAKYSDLDELSSVFAAIDETLKEVF